MVYKVDYAAVTHSRAGSYVYRFVDKVEAESKEDAVSKVKATVKQNHSQWKFRLFKVTEA